MGQLIDAMPMIMMYTGVLAWGVVILGLFGVVMYLVYRGIRDVLR